MLLQLFTRDDETGILDGEHRDGDVFAVKPDSNEGTLGNIEKKTFLFIKVPDPANVQKFIDEMPVSEYGVPQADGELPPVRHAKKYRVDWRAKFTAAEIAVIEDATQTLPDGSTSGGGSVTSGVVSDLFTINDAIRK